MKIRTILFFALVMATGCKKFLTEEPKGILVGDVAISSVEGLNAQLGGAYGKIIGDFGGGFSTAAVISMSMGGDDVTTHPGLNKQDFREFDQFNVTSLNARMPLIWNGLFKTIQGANNIINNYATVEGDQNTINQIAGEAFFLRGVCYYYLTRWWGKLPLITKANFDEAMLTVGRSSIADVYAQIESDLTQAESLLADEKPAPGRVNKGTAKAYLADAYLTEAGWPTKDASKAALAAAKAKEVIENKAAYGFDLYQGGFAKIFAGGTSEDVFTLFTDNNVNSNHYYGLSGIPGDAGGWDDYCAEANFYLSYPEGERKDATFLTSVDINGTTVPWQNFSIKHPYYQKFKIQTGAPVLDYSSASPILLMRYAEVLLDYAEAQARASGPDALAYSSLNAVRERAGLGDLTGLSTPAFIDSVVAERGWEFAAEWHRWFDLIRTETVGSANAHRAAQEIPLIGNPSDETKWLMPVPGTEVSINPNLNN